MSDHEHDEHGNCIIPPPTWRFSAWDVAGVATTTVAGVLLSVGQGVNLLAREFYAMANWSRNVYDIRQAQLREEAARQEMAEAYKEFVFGDDRELP